MKGLTTSDSKTHAQKIRMYAWFYLNRGGLDEGWMNLPPPSSNSSWKELIKNIIAIKLEYTG